jgi:hypothetical protein
MKNLTLSQAMKFIEDIACESLNNYNSKHPNKPIELLLANSYKLGVTQVLLANLLAKHETIDELINNYKHLLPMDKE